MTVVDDHEERPACGERAVRGLEDPERVAGGRVVTAEGEALERRSVPGHVRQPPEKLARRGERDRLGRLKADEAHAPGCAGLASDLDQEAGLARAGLAGDDNCPRQSIGARAPLHCQDRLELEPAADKRRTHERSVIHAMPALSRGAGS